MSKLYNQEPVIKTNQKIIDSVTSNHKSPSEVFLMRQKNVGITSIFILILVLLALAVWLPDLTPQQYVILKFAFATLAGWLAGTFTGFIEVKGEIAKFPIRIGGGIAVFMIVLFLFPEPHQKEKEGDKSSSITTIKQISNGEDAIQIGENKGELHITTKASKNSSIRSDQ